MPYNFVNATGVILADTSTLKTEVEAEYQDVFGADLDLAPETPEGILITAETTSRAGIATNNAQLANQINPNRAGGVFLDAIWALTGGARAGATSSTFPTPPNVTGVAGTPIPEGSLAATAAGDQFITLGDVTLSTPDGLGSVAFASVEKGPIPCAIGELSSIISGVLGWETVTNTVAAELGTDTQTDISARRERNDTLGAQGSGISVAIFSNVRAVTGVRSLTFRENITASGTVIDGVTLVANSIWVCVDGNDEASELDIATALLGAKSPGAAWNNGTSGDTVSQNVTDPLSGQVYTVLYDKPDLIPVEYQVTVSSSNVSNAEAIVKSAILAYAAGELDGEPGLVVGADVSPFEAAGAINVVEPRIQVKLVEVTTVVDANPQPATIDIGLFEQATVLETQILVIFV